MSKVFGQTVVVDTEYEIEPGNLPNLLCLVAYVLDENLQHVRTIRMWREELFASKQAPFDVGPDTLFVAYNASADLKCFLTRNWRFPIHVYDPYIAYRAESNLLLPYEPMKSGQSLSEVWHMPVGLTAFKVGKTSIKRRSPRI
jgi:hypothetical protein